MILDRKNQLIVVTALLLVSPAASYAGPRTDLTVSASEETDTTVSASRTIDGHSKIKINEVTAIGNINLRSSHPKNTIGWYSMGSKIGVVIAGETLIVEDKTQIKNFMVDQEWIKVRRISAQINGPVVGWIYTGGGTYISGVGSERTNTHTGNSISNNSVFGE